MIGQDKKSFEYGGWHFTPYRQFDKRDGGYNKISRNVESDFAMGLCTYSDRKKFNYSYDEFYAASYDPFCSIFRCEENGRLYVPGLNELSIYHEPKEKNRAAKDSVMGTLEKSKQERPVPNQKAGPSRKGGDR